jgi:hypothetical protein
MDLLKNVNIKNLRERVKKCGQLESIIPEVKEVGTC